MFTNANYADKERMEYAMEKIKVLVVDDESRMRKLVSDFLTRDGYEVIEAGDGEEAVEIFFQNKDIAVILLDVMMPKMNGWQVLKTIREYSQVPVIMLTAKGEEQDELHGFDLGVDEYISKPFSPKILVPVPWSTSTKALPTAAPMQYWQHPCSTTKNWKFLR